MEGMGSGRALFDRAPVGLVLLDTAGLIVTANARAATSLGLAPSELPRRALLDLVHEADRDALRSHLGAHDVDAIDVRIPGPRGDRWVAVTVAPFEQNRLLALHELGERKVFERSLSDSADRFEAFMDASPALVAWMKDDGGRFVYLNETHAKALSLSREDVLGKTAFDVYPKERAAAATALDAAVSRTLEPALTIEESGAAGDRRAWQTVRFLFWDAAGASYTGAVGVDVTAERRAEEALAKTREQLRQAQKMEAVGRLAGGIAHDFNNLLTVVLTYSDLLAREVADPHARRHASEINESAQRAAQLTRKLLTFSRQQATQPQVLDLNDLVREMRSLLLPITREDIELVLDLAPSVKRVFVDKGAVGQLMMNLVVNARDAIPGQGKITISTADVSLDDAAAAQRIGAKPGSYILLSVRDTGAGMDLETQSRAFEPFFTTKEAGKGTGLGLSIVLGIVQQAGGAISFDSAPSAGTCFSIYLPEASRAAEAIGAEAPVRVTPRGRETILLVDDNDGVRLVAERILTACGYRVLAASGPKAALQLLDREPQVDLLLTDAVMPEMSGVELTNAVVAKRPGVKVLFFSGYASEELPAIGVSFLPKPFTSPELSSQVRKVLDS